ncbi:unnamed protein product [Darwinula stevensoni]|uniref:RING-type domain-containing protein n=1 Tax=Darwinula stevensoni TaxID=69355 RepID=A0A7R8ZZB7_9CRUS|nr:unnamed protein product [Darwinula stevensoni]CAG0883282.1 unnamed protein product [Darwinula stevensoni]
MQNVSQTVIYETLKKYGDDLLYRREKALEELLNANGTEGPRGVAWDAPGPSNEMANSSISGDPTSTWRNHLKRRAKSVLATVDWKKARVETEPLSPDPRSSVPNGSNLENLERLTLLHSIFPDCDPLFLKIKCDDCNGDDEALQALVHDMLNLRNYPRLEDTPKRKSLDLKRKYNDMSLEEFLKLVHDPLQYFYRTDRPASPAYVKLTTAYLEKNFPHHAIETIAALLLENNSLLAPTVKAMRVGNFKLKRRRRSASKEDEAQETDEEFLKELTFLRLEAEIRDDFERQRDLREREKREARRTGSLLECPICCEDELICLDMEACSAGHIFCRSCVTRFDYTFQSKFPLACPLKLLRPSVMSRILRQRQAEEIRTAGIPNLESCPSCYFAIIMENPEEKLFRCLNPECMHESCRFCKEPNHIPLSCDEVEKEEEVKARTYLENEMSESMIRECYKCRKRFIKAGGCNTIHCSCGAEMCYNCKKPRVSGDFLPGSDYCIGS